MAHNVVAAVVSIRKQGEWLRRSSAQQGDPEAAVLVEYPTVTARPEPSRGEPSVDGKQRLRAEQRGLHGARVHLHDGLGRAKHRRLQVRHRRRRGRKGLEVACAVMRAEAPLKLSLAVQLHNGPAGLAGPGVEKLDFARLALFSLLR